MTVLENILSTLAGMTVEGNNGLLLEDMASKLLELNECEAAFKGYQPKGFKSAYPNVICVSINGEVIHGIPDDRKFQDGDVVKIDIGLKDKDGQFDDRATTVVIGRGSAAVRRLIKGTQEALEAGIAKAKPGYSNNNIAAAIEAVAKKYDLTVIHGFGGHGIGTELHMEPFIPNEVTYHLEEKKNPEGALVVDSVHPAEKETVSVLDVPSFELKSGMRIAIEPMFSTNRGETYVDKNGWTIKINGGGIAAHFEKTVTI